MTVLAHGSVGYADEAVLVVPALVGLVLFIGWLRRTRERHGTRD